MEARVVLLPDGLDPDDFLVQRGADAFRPLLERAQPLLEFLVLTTLKRNGAGPEAKQRALKTLVPILSEIGQQATRELAVRHLADLMEVRAESVLELLAAPRRPRGPQAGAPEEPSPDTLTEAAGLARRDLRHQRLLLALLLRQRALMPLARGLLAPEDLSDPQLRGLYETLLRLEPEQFAAVDMGQLGQQFPQLDAALRGLLVDEPRSLNLTDREGRPAIRSGEAELRAQIAYVKEQEKERLWQHFKRAVGTAEEDLTMRRFLRLRNELRDLMGEARSENGSGDGKSGGAGPTPANPPAA
jgi:DNA primase